MMIEAFKIKLKEQSTKVAALEAELTDVVEKATRDSEMFTQ